MINADDNKSRNNNSNKIYDSGNNDNKNHINGIGNYSTKDNEHDNDKLILIRKIMMMTSKIIMKMIINSCINDIDYYYHNTNINKYNDNHSKIPNSQNLNSLKSDIFEISIDFILSFG